MYHRVGCWWIRFGRYQGWSLGRGITLPAPITTILCSPITSLPFINDIFFWQWFQNPDLNILLYFYDYGKETKNSTRVHIQRRSVDEVLADRLLSLVRFPLKIKLPKLTPLASSKCLFLEHISTHINMLILETYFEGNFHGKYVDSTSYPNSPLSLLQYVYFWQVKSWQHIWKETFTTSNVMFDIWATYSICLLQV